MTKSRRMRGGGYPSNWAQMDQQHKKDYCEDRYTSVRQGGFFGKAGGYDLVGEQCIKNGYKPNNFNYQTGMNENGVQVASMPNKNYVNHNQLLYPNGGKRKTRRTMGTMRTRKVRKTRRSRK